MRLFRFESGEELENEALKVTNPSWQDGGHQHRLSYRQVIETARTGDPAIVAKAEKLLDSFLDASSQITERQWEASPYGAYPVVPEYLTGFPDPMRCLTPRDCESSPAEIWVDLSCSAGVSYDTLEKRGIAVLALVMKLQAIRPVDLYLCVGSQTNGVAVALHVNTRPLDLATAAFMMADGQFCRLPMAAILRNASGGYWGSVPNEETFRKWFGIPAESLVISALHLHYSSECMRDPVGWVNKQLRHFGAVQEAA